MSKWIQGFPPCKNGYYLTCRILPGFEPTTSVARKERYNYDGERVWRDRYGSAIFSNDQLFVEFLEKRVIFWWWDEFGIAENIRIRKISFTKPQNREI